MNSVYCAPDLTFWQTVLWHSKQMGSIILIWFVAIALGVAVYVAYEKTKK